MADKAALETPAAFETPAVLSTTLASTSISACLSCPSNSVAAAGSDQCACDLRCGLLRRCQRLQRLRQRHAQDASWLEHLRNMSGQQRDCAGREHLRDAVQKNIMSNKLILSSNMGSGVGSPASLYARSLQAPLSGSVSSSSSILTTLLLQYNEWSTPAATPARYTASLFPGTRSRRSRAVKDAIAGICAPTARGAFSSLGSRSPISVRSTESTAVATICCGLRRRSCSSRAGARL